MRDAVRPRYCRVSQPFSNQRHDLGLEQSYDWETQRVTLPDGKYGVVCYFSDVTERNRTEQTVRDSEARFRATFNNAAGLVTSHHFRLC